jgi:serine/threonine protein kinase/Tfp pilus assembly protein PilF
MSCPHCGSDAAAHSGRCSGCGATLLPNAPAIEIGLLTPAPPPSDVETRLVGEGGATGSPAGSTGHTQPLGPLNAGQNFGTRYHIIRALGVGGMGAVYQAWDQELEVAVAVKVIRPDVTANPTIAQELERRFKRELLLARQVTHKNVVRIHDIGEIEGIKYLTMPYVQGSDLATILRREGRLPLPRALAIARQVASGLVAAHDAGVVHRDLKPANIMVGAEDHALIMDFGIARSTTAGFAMTVAGAVVGTIEYMAPEQAKGEAVDQRADVYAFGLILRDLLLGGRNAGMTTAVAELMARMQHAPPSLRTLDAHIPEALDDLVTRCLQPEPVARYQTSASLLADLERIAEGGQAISIPVPTPVPGKLKVRRVLTPALGVLGGLALMTVVGLMVKDRFFSASKPTPTTAAAVRVVSLAVMPFRNATGDPTLDSLGTSLSEVLATDLGEASHLRTIPSERLHEVLRDLRIDPHASLSPRELGRIADFASARSILWGQYLKFGDEIRIDATLQDLQQQKTTQLKASAANQGALLTAVAELAGIVQQTLAAGSADVLSELKSSAWRPSTQSFEALRLYNDGLQLSRQGSHQAALKRFEAAIQEDANFALAYSALAETYSNLGYDTQATQQSRRAVGLSESLPPQERYLIAATHYRIAKDTEKGIETYEKLLKVSPNNARIQFELARLYEQTGQLEKAQEQFAKAVELDPKHVDGLTAVGRVAIKRGDPQVSLQPLNNALSLSVQLNNEEARANVLQAIGVAYKRLGRPSDALNQFQDSLAIKRRIGQKAGIAVSLAEIAQIQETLGKPQEALDSYQEALKLQREIGDKSRMPITLINLGALLNENLGRPDDALTPLREALTILRDQGDRSTEALALNNIGTVYLAKGQYSDAQTYFERALEIREQTKVPRELADTLHNLGETLNKMSKYDQALTRYLRALDLRRKDGDKRGEAVESYSIGAIFDYQGLYGAAAKSKAEALQTFRDLKQRDFWFGEILSGHGSSLALSGRLDEAAKSLEEALAVARELKNAGLIAQVLRFQADRLHYAGDTRGASRLAEQAAQAASRASDRTLDLWAQAVVARTSAAAQPARPAAAALAKIGRDAEMSGLTYLSIYCSLASAETLLRIGDHQPARQEAEQALAKAETLGLRELLARSEWVLATTMRLSADPQARRHYGSALQLLEEMKREDGNEKVLERADLKTIYAECLQWSKAV